MYPHSVIQIVTAIILCVDPLIIIIISTATTKKAVGKNVEEICSLWYLRKDINLRSVQMFYVPGLDSHVRTSFKNRHLTVSSSW